MNTMRRYILLLLAILSVWGLRAGDLDYTIAHLGERDINGSARYIGMAGAMTAVGGDPSAIVDNPAGLGVYRRFEILTTLCEHIDYTAPVGINSKYTNHSFQFPQVSFVFSFGSDYNHGLKYSNLMFGFNRLKTFNRTSTVSSTAALSIADYIALQTNGLTESDLSVGSAVWNNSEIGFLSALGYNTYAISPVEGETGLWKSYRFRNEQVRSTFELNESGYMDAFNIAWGGNINDRLYIGAGINILSLYYSKSTSLREEPAEGGTLLARTVMAQSGVGVNGSVGIMVHPVRMLRLGASLQTPSVIKIRTSTYGEMESNNFESNPDGSSYWYMCTPTYRYDRNFSMPLRATAGAALLFGEQGMLSLEYDLDWWGDEEKVRYVGESLYEDVQHKYPVYNHTFKVGTELVVHHNFFFNLGYAFSSSFAERDRVRHVDYNSVYTNTEYSNLSLSHYAGAAFGYRGNTAIVQLGYQYRWQQSNMYTNPLQEMPYDLKSQTHRIALTIAWHNM